MHPVRKKRLITISAILVIIGAAVGLMLYALQQNINLFYSPSQVSEGEAPNNVMLRVGGIVVEGSINRDPNSLAVQFEVTDYAHTVTVEYKGILPDLFREGQGIVAQGKLNQDKVLIAQEVLAKHDENYMPPEIAEALDNAKKKEY